MMPVSMTMSLSLSCLTDPLAERLIYCARLSVLERAEFKTLLQDIMPEEGRTCVAVASSPPPSISVAVAVFHHRRR